MNLPDPNTSSASEQLELPHTKPDSFMKVALFSALVACGMALYLFWQNQQLEYQLALSRQVIASPSPSPSPTSDPTANWDTYLNKEHQFSFRFPNNWKNITDQATIDNGNNEVQIKTNSGEYIVATYFKVYDAKFVEKPGIKQFVKGSSSVVLRYVTNIGEGGQIGVKSIGLFDQILSTFKFTD